MSMASLYTSKTPCLRRPPIRIEPMSAGRRRPGASATPDPQQVVRVAAGFQTARLEEGTALSSRTAQKAGMSGNICGARGHRLDRTCRTRLPSAGDANARARQQGFFLLVANATQEGRRFAETVRPRDNRGVSASDQETRTQEALEDNFDCSDRRYSSPLRGSSSRPKFR